MKYLWKNKFLHAFFLFLSVHVPLCAMDSGKKRGYDEIVDSSSVKKAKFVDVSNRGVSSLKFFAAAHIAKKKIKESGNDEQVFESFSQLYPEDIAHMQNGYSRYDSATVQLPDDLAQYVFAVERLKRYGFNAMKDENSL